MIELVYPFPLSHSRDLLDWLMQEPRQNLDDFGCRTEDQVREELTERAWRRELTWEVIWNDLPVGIIGFAKQSPYLGMLRGICFHEAVHGSPATRIAMGMALERMFLEVRRVEAVYFSDNARVRAFLAKFGFRYEGTMRGRTLRDGIPVDMEMVGLLADDFQNSRERIRQSAGETRPHAPEALPTPA